MRSAIAVVLLLSTGCSPRSKTCGGEPPTTALVEGYCKNGEAADRCYFNPAPMDGF
jgi:hypothetical protein